MTETEDITDGIADICELLSVGSFRIIDPESIREDYRCLKKYDTTNSMFRHACYSSCSHVVKMMIEEKADVDLTPRQMWTPLVSCCVEIQKPEFPLIRMLVEAGANVNVTDSVGFTALHHLSTVRGGSCLPVIRFLLENGAIPSLWIRSSDRNTPLDVSWKFAAFDTHHELSLRMEKAGSCPVK
jgi:hypothetical protein